MEKYVGAKIISAEPMDEVSFLTEVKKQKVAERETRPGYHVIYPDGYHSWSPKEVFEKAYRLVSVDEMTLLTTNQSHE